MLRLDVTLKRPLKEFSAQAEACGTCVGSIVWNGLGLFEVFFSSVLQG